jgi:Zn-finger nucleic acid-binding protein
MQAGSLQCPNCGAAANPDEPSCGHCGSKLATVACPSCFGMLFLGAQFCPHCGTQAARWEHDDRDLPCPHCETPMVHASVGRIRLHECTDCHGLWLEMAALELVSHDADTQSFLARKHPLTAGFAMAGNFRYRPCPVCHDLMARRNFGQCSGVVVDQCRDHGTWFDHRELQAVVQFIRAGGLQRARQRQLDELKRARERSSLDSPETINTQSANWNGASSGNSAGLLGDIVGLVADVITSLD